MEKLYLNGFICVIGLGLHFSLKWLEARQKAEAKAAAPPGVGQFIKDTPAQSAISVLSTVGAFTVCYGLDWLNEGMAFACGYMGNSLAENLVSRFSKLP